MNRNLDGVYFRVKRDGGFEAVCFSDLTPKERDKVLEGRSEEWLKKLCCILADVLKEIGDTFELIGE